MCVRSFSWKTIIKKKGQLIVKKRERERESLCVCLSEKDTEREQRRLLFIIVGDLVVVTDCFLRQKKEREKGRDRVGAQEKKIIKTLSQPKITFFCFFSSLFIALKIEGEIVCYCWGERQSYVITLIEWVTEERERRGRGRLRGVIMRKS
jgi:hypothetical protein